MKTPHISLGHALEALPEIDDLEGLRSVLQQLARDPAESAGSDDSVYRPMDRREVEVGVLPDRVPEIVDRVRTRLERTVGATTESLVALARGEETEAARRMIEAGEAEETAWRLEEAERFYAKALEMARRPKDRGAESLALRRLGRVARQRGKLVLGKRYYREAYLVSEAQQDSASMATSALGLGNVHVDCGEWGEAHRWYEIGLWRHGERPSAEYLHFCNGLSVVERRLGHFEESGAWILAGEAAADELGDVEAKNYLEHGRARLLLARGDRQGGVRLLRELLAGDLDDVARISSLINLAEALIDDGTYREAWTALRSAEALALRHRVLRLLPAVYETLGKLAAARRDLDGFVFFEQALDLVRELRLPATRFAEIQLAYGRFDAAVGHRPSAAARFELAIEVYRETGAAPDLTEAGQALKDLGSESIGRSDPAAAHRDE